MHVFRTFWNVMQWILKFYDKKNKNSSIAVFPPFFKVMTWRLCQWNCTEFIPILSWICGCAPILLPVNFFTVFFCFLKSRSNRVIIFHTICEIVNMVSFRIVRRFRGFYLLKSSLTYERAEDTEKRSRYRYLEWRRCRFYYFWIPVLWIRILMDPHWYWLAGSDPHR